MGLRPELLRGIYAHGYVWYSRVGDHLSSSLPDSFERPSSIQQRAIVPVIKNRDVIVQAQSGTGKTATLSISVLQKLDPTNKATQALILAPTNKLALQTREVLGHLGQYMSITLHLSFDGIDAAEQSLKLQEGAHVVIGTPDGVYHMISRGDLKTDSIKMFCLDGADEMLSSGCKERIYDIFKLLPSGPQVLLSSPMSAGVLEAAKELVRDPVRILVKRNELTLEGVKQFQIAVEREEWKLDTLCDLYEAVTITQAVIFCNNRRKVDWLTEQMRAREYTVSAMVRSAGRPRKLLRRLITSFDSTEMWIRNSGRFR